MAIDINSLFADIIDTPEQRQQKLLQQGMAQGQLLSSGLRGRAAALAPLAQMAGQLGVQRNEDLRRGVQPMLGIDPRSTSEKLQAALSNIDTSTPAGLLEAANMVQSIDPMRAATLRQAAAEQRKADEDRAKSVRLQELQLSAAEREEALAEQAEESKAASIGRYRAMGVPDAFVESYKNGELSAKDLMVSWSEQLSAKAKVKPFKFESLKGEDLDTAVLAIDKNEKAQDLLRQTKEGTGINFLWKNWGGQEVFDEQSLIDEAAVWRVLNPSMTVTEAVEAAVTSLPNGGARAVLASGGLGADEQMQRSFNIATGNIPSVSPQNINLGQPQPDSGLSIAGFNEEVDSIFAEASALQQQLDAATTTDGTETPAQPATRETVPFREAVRRSFDFSGRGGSSAETEGGASASDYLKAVEGLNFPALSTVARNIPVAQKVIVDSFSALSTALSSVDNLKQARDAGLDKILNSTAKIVGNLVEGQASSREQGEDIARNIQQAKDNIEEMKSKLGKLSPPSRRVVVNQLNKLEQAVLSEAARLAGQVFD